MLEQRKGKSLVRKTWDLENGIPRQEEKGNSHDNGVGRKELSRRPRMQPARLEKDREFQEEINWKENKIDRLSGICLNICRQQLIRHVALSINWKNKQTENCTREE